MNSKFGKLNSNDFIKGLVVAVVFAVLTGILQILESGNMPNASDFKVIGISALTAGVSYLAKNFVTSSDGQLLKKE